MSDDLESFFPNLRGSGYRITSPATRRYNCIAFAASKTDKWWWPADFSYWPDGVPREATLQAFILAFGTLGYTPCDHGSPESGFEKVAIYTNEQRSPTHMARQLSSGTWTSKCGQLEDIEHETLKVLEGSRPNDYGTVVQYLKRRV
jgi:hypothetical protein